MTRTAAILPWIAARCEAEVWPFGRAVSAAPGAITVAEAEASHVREGLNFATQDYLSLGSHPAVKHAAEEALRRYGVHSGGSSAIQGRSDISLALEREIGDALQMEHVVLFSTGWGAAFGAVTGFHACTTIGFLSVRPCAQFGWHSTATSVPVPRAPSDPQLVHVMSVITPVPSQL